MASGNAITIRDVIKSYPIGRNKITIFDRLVLDVPSGEFLVVMGPSGSGKSTILNLIGGIDRADSGEILVGEAMINRMNEGALTRWRRNHVGFVFQFYNLMPMMSAQQNVELPLLLTSLGKRERQRRVRTILEVVGLDDRRSHLPSELSGGQQQRVGIARAIVTDPGLLLCDEPTGDLDRKSSGEILEILQMLNKDLGKTVVMVTHDESATSCADRTLFLDKGVFVPRAVKQCA